MSPATPFRPTGTNKTENATGASPRRRPAGDRRTGTDEAAG
ncbi:hypothetical protein [Streptomyces sp. NPDC013455]